MKVARIIVFVLLLTASCYAQNGSKDKRVPDQAYLTRLARLVTGLQKKNPWMGWEYGTEMTVTHLGDGKSPVATKKD
jgi:hypothetical protein